MKKIIVLLLAFVLFINSFPLSISAYTAYTISELQGKYKTQGRTEISNGSLVMEWSASGIEFNAECSGNVEITVDTTRLWTGNNCGLYFTVIVDGVIQFEDLRIPKNNNANSWTSNITGYPFHITKTGKTTFVIAENLKSGFHTFEIYNQNEAKNGSFGIYSISLNGRIVDAPSEKDKYIEFVGDSITAGLGNLSVGGQEAPLYQDATKGWPYLTANKLDSDWSVIAVSGITAGKGYGWEGLSSVSMQDVYTKLRYYSSAEEMYNFIRQPDVIVLGLGTNDFWTYGNNGKTLDDVKVGFKETLKLLRRKNPDSKIVWIYGMMINNADSLINTVISEMNDENIYAFQLPINTSGGQGHPNLEAQSIYAEKLSVYLSNLLNNSTNSNKIPESNLNLRNKNIWDGTIVAPKNIGYGVYEISTPEQLAYVISTGGGEGNTYNLTADIYLNDLEKINWVTGEFAAGYNVNSWYTKGKWEPFNGNINGNGYTIYGLYYKDNDGNSPSDGWPMGAGLVPYMGKGTIKNIGVDYSYIYNYDMFSTAAIVGGGHDTINATIEQCYAGQNVTVKGYDVGGIAGGGNSLGKVMIRNCYSLATLEGTNCVGGIIGSSWQNDVWTAINCYTLNKATGGNWQIAELANVYETLDGNGAIIVDKSILVNEIAKSTLVGFDFEEVWSVSREFPVLKIFVEQKIGDSNNDKDINIIDLVRLKKTIVNNEYDKYLDLNGNSSIDSLDLVIMRKHVLDIVSIAGDLEFPYYKKIVDDLSEYVIVVPFENSKLLESAKLLQDYYSSYEINLPIFDDDTNIDKKAIIIGLSSSNENFMKVEIKENNLIISADYEKMVDSAIRRFIRLNEAPNVFSLFEDETDFKSTVLDGYQYVWGDEFEDAELDMSKWCFDAAMEGTADIELSCDTDVISSDGGYLKLKSIKYSTIKNGEIQYRVPYSVSTKENMCFKYGYAEIKCRLPMFSGVWPSFWTRSNGSLGVYKKTNYFAEVDIFEIFGNKSIIPGIIKWYDDGTHSYWIEYNTVNTWNWENKIDVMSEYHTYGWEWTPQKMVMYVDGIEYMTFNITKNFDNRDNMDAFHNPMFIMFNNHLISDTSWQPGPIIEECLNGLPGKYYIDYFRLYQKSDVGELYTNETTG